jgi:hypothetical protein
MLNVLDFIHPTRRPGGSFLFNSRSFMTFGKVRKSNLEMLATDVHKFCSLTPSL